MTADIFRHNNGFSCFHLNLWGWAACSVTRFGEISPLWHKLFKSLAILKALFSVLQNFESALGHFWCSYANFPCCTWPNIEKWSSRLVTLNWAAAYVERKSYRCDWETFACKKDIFKTKTVANLKNALPMITSYNARTVVMTRILPRYSSPNL